MATVRRSLRTVTLLFTDIEGSTRLWEEAEEEMRGALARHDSLVARAVAEHGGEVFKTVGDAFCAVFESATSGVSAALEAQRALLAETWPDGMEIRVRIALHTGEVECRDGDYFGPPVNRVARLLATGHGGQTLVSGATAELLRGGLPEGAGLRDLGRHRLKDLARPEQVFQVLHPGLPENFPQLRSLSTHPNNLPSQLTSFIGREQEMAELLGLLPRSRLVTLTGAGGCGKTRLGLQVAAEALGSFPDGAWQVELAPLAEPSLLAQTVADAIGAKLQAGSDTDALVEFAQGRRLLIVLDNCEHLLSACASLAGELLARCPGVQILATSREPLGIVGERVYRVPSLGIPEEGSGASLEELLKVGAARLFVERAQLSRPGFAIEERSVSSLVSVCRRLDGIPLAIELAAARVKSLSVEEIDTRLDQRFRLLTGGSRTAMPRQQTLRALIDWSYNLLAEGEQSLLARLAVFSGGWTLEAAEAVCSDPAGASAGAAIDAEDVLDLLDSLADKSLVIVEHGRDATRYGLLETVRAYAADRLMESGDMPHRRGRHLEYFMGLAERAEPEVGGGEQALWIERLETEHENIRRALAWAGEVPDDGDALLRTAAALGHFWWIRAHWREGLAHLEGALSRSRACAAPGLVAKALNSAGSLAMKLGDFEKARALHAECLEVRTGLGDVAGIAASSGNLGLVAQAQGDHHAAKEFFETAARAFRQLGEPVRLSTALACLAEIAMAVGDDDEAAEYFAEGVATARQSGERVSLAHSLSGVGSVQALRGDYEGAKESVLESMGISEELGIRRGVFWCQELLGFIAGRQGQTDEAHELYRLAIAGFAELGAADGLVAALEGLARLLAEGSDFERAAQLWGAAEAHRARLGHPLWPKDAERLSVEVAQARAATSDLAAFEAAWQVGAGLGLDEAAGLATEPVTRRLA